MIKNYVHKKRPKFDMDADWLPQKNKQFVMKGSDQQPHEPTPGAKPTPDAKPMGKTTDAKGLKTAYASESGFYRDPDKTLHMAGTRGSFVGEDWMENYKAYGPSLFNTMKDYYGLLNSGKFEFKDWFAPKSQPNNIDTQKCTKH